MGIDLTLVRELASVPIGIAALFVVYRLSTNFVERIYTLSSNHMNHLAAALDRLADAVKELRDDLRGR